VNNTYGHVIRIPKEDYDEIIRIANKLNIKIGAAYQIWKKKKIETNFQWKEV